MDDQLIIDPREVPELLTAEQSRNFVQEKILEVREMIRTKPPPPTNRLDGISYLRWERRLFILHGQAVGALQALQAFGHIPVPMFYDLKNMIIGTMLRKVAGVQMGTDPHHG